MTATIGSSTKLFPTNAELPMADAASTWANSTVGSTSIFVPSFLEHSIAFSKGDINSTSIATTSAPVDNVISSYYTSTPFPDSQPHGVLIDDAEAKKSFIADTYVDSDQNDYGTTLRNATKVMANIETDRIPCPRLCGASFSIGVGGLASKYCKFCSPSCSIHFSF
jgi:hypothetical protein